LLTLVYQSEEPSLLFENEMRKLAGVLDVQCIWVDSINLAKGFNKAIAKAQNDIVVLVKEDVRICSEDWAKKVIEAFDRCDHGILGTLGTLIIPKSGMLWEHEEPLCGSIWYEKYSPKHKNAFGEDFGDKILDVIALEGSFIALHKKRVKCKMDESFQGDSFYENDYCLSNFKKGIRVGVFFGVDILKKNFDEQDANFVKNHKYFVAKHKDLPLRLNPQVLVNDELVKVDGALKVNIVIPVKGHVEEVIGCIKSIIQKTCYINYTITIADYGSTLDEKDKILEFLQKEKKVLLIETKWPQVSQVLNEVTENVKSDLVMFLSKEIRFENDALSLMVKTYQKHKANCGTIGLRSHQKNHMVRQFGLQLYSYETEDGDELGLDFKGFGKAYSYRNQLVKGVMGNSVEALMIERELFLNLGGFNTNYHHSLEDFELNLKCIIEGRKNYLVGEAVATHTGIGRPKFLPKDYLLLMDYVNDNIKSLLPYVSLIAA